MAERADVREDRSGGRRPERPRRPGRTLLAVVAGLLIGLAAAVLVPQLLEDDDGTAAPVGDDQGGTLADERADAAADARQDGPAPEGAGATSAEAAVTGFLDAEVSGEYESSFGYLSDDDRRLYATPAGWVGRHADVLAPILGYEVVEVRPDGTSSEVVTEVRFEPGLDQVTGLTPGAARITWTAVEGPTGTWGVDLDESVMEPLPPPDEGAAAAAQAWVDARRACEPADDEGPALVGSPALADRLCDADDVVLGPVERLDGGDATTIATAYGPAAAAASRIVRVGGTTELGVVLVPIGDTWTAIAVVP